MNDEKAVPEGEATTTKTVKPDHWFLKSGVVLALFSVMYIGAGILRHPGTAKELPYLSVAMLLGQGGMLLVGFWMIQAYQGVTKRLMANLFLLAPSVLIMASSRRLLESGNHDFATYAPLAQFGFVSVGLLASWGFNAAFFVMTWTAFDGMWTLLGKLRDRFAA